jgi:serine/threonine protein kinase
MSVAIVAVTALLLWFMRVMARKKDTERKALSERLLGEKDELIMEVKAGKQELSVLRSVWEINPDELRVFESIGQGSFGSVYRGRWRNMVVAIKNLHEAYASMEEFRKELDNEATMLRTVRHAHIVQFIGAGTWPNGCPFLVTEYMELGSLTSVLKKRIINWDQKFIFAYEIASGMALVHSLGRIHRDLKSGNVLVTAGQGGVLHAKVADFGTAGFAGSARSHTAITDIDRTLMMTSTMTTMLGTPLWMAPEIIAGQRHYSRLVDVYSYGIVMWEIAAQSLPWSDLPSPFVMQGLLRMLNEGVRPPVGPEWPSVFRDMMVRCWATDPTCRPEFKDVATSLSAEISQTLSSA